MDRLEKKKRTHKTVEERQSEILRAASQIFSQHGYKLTDIQTIAETAGVGKGTVYRCFSSKETLFRATIDHHLNALAQHGEWALDSADDPLEKVKAVMLAYLHFFEDNPEVIELFAQERAEFRDQAESAYLSLMKKNHEKWLELFHEVADRYECRNIEVEELMNICSYMMHGAAMMPKPLPQQRSVEQRVATLFQVYTQGILLHPLNDIVVR
ncbi:TetR family transcriptional regulator [Idiomarina aquatica]|uniref:TetR family transcriptional regulator n=1 Tax=Idiomarina aquatica TaxID=1327752 RepID=A0A4R6NXA8_9GAMM|nr:TetR/AcrR family transcriptional regulator [Idiomarina aquatica]TDP28428.1 TetR family transcriptional regulator [Idiomarina aquatica]